MRPKVRIFPASSVTEIYHSPDDSGLITKDGKTQYIDDILMLKYSEIFEHVQRTYKHISTSNV